MVASAAVLQQVRGEMRKLKTAALEEAPYQFNWLAGTLRLWLKPQNYVKGWEPVL